MISISVVIPTYNRPEKIRDAILSISNQTELPDELVVVDDGSDIPLSNRIFNGVQSKVKCLLLRNENSMGANFSRNKGVEYSQSEWVSFLDDDDEFEPEKIEEIRKAISRDRMIDFLYHSATIYMVNEGVSYKSSSSGPLSGNMFENLLEKNIVGGTSVATIKKEAIMEVGGFDENIPALQDYDLWLRLAKEGKSFCFIDKPLLKYHHVTKTKSISKSLSNNKIAIDIIEKKHRSYYETLSRKQKKEHEMWKQKMRVHKSLINGQYIGAIKEQLVFFQKFPSAKSFIALVMTFFGPKIVFKLKAHIS